MTLHKTRYNSCGCRLFYGRVEPGCWSFFVSEMGGEPAQVGTHYTTKEELLTDLDRYAAFYGF